MSSVATYGPDNTAEFTSGRGSRPDRSISHARSSWNFPRTVFEARNELLRSAAMLSPIFRKDRTAGKQSSKTEQEKARLAHGDMPENASGLVASVLAQRAGG